MYAVRLRGRLTPWLGLWWVVLTLLLQGCSLKLVADYDSASVDQLLAAYEKVDHFYDRLAETAPADRTYDAFQSEWSSIATDLRTFALRQRGRDLNEQSEEIADMLVERWEQARFNHRQRQASDDPARHDDPYPTSVIALDRAQFDDWFYKAISAEKFKQ